MAAQLFSDRFLANGRPPVISTEVVGGSATAPQSVDLIVAALEKLVKQEMAAMEDRLEARMLSHMEQLQGKMVEVATSAAHVVTEERLSSVATVPPSPALSEVVPAAAAPAEVSGASGGDGSESARSRAQRHRCERILEKFANDAVYGKSDEPEPGVPRPTLAMTTPRAGRSKLSKLSFLERRRRKHRFDVDSGKPLPFGILHPNGSFRHNWDAMAIALVLFLSVSLPYRVAFVDGADPTVMVAIDVMIDFFFIFDIVVNATTAYLHEDHLIYDRRKILRNYAKVTAAHIHPTRPHSPYRYACSPHTPHPPALALSVCIRGRTRLGMGSTPIAACACCTAACRRGCPSTSSPPFLSNGSLAFRKQQSTGRTEQWRGVRRQESCCRS